MTITPRIETVTVSARDQPTSIMQRLYDSEINCSIGARGMWIVQWVQWPTTSTTGGACWRRTHCLVQNGRVVAMWAE